jgi:hypothetical protein
MEYSNNKKCLIIYLGNAYSEKTLNYSKEYMYSVDLRDNKSNHIDNIYAPLISMGYNVETLMLTNKHKYSDLFLDMFSAYNFEYNEFTDDELKNLYGLYWMRTPQGWGPGIFKAGARLLKVKDEIPKTYDLYVIIRADCLFKKSLIQMDVDYDKINYLFPETDNQFFTHNREFYLDNHGDELIFFREYLRVNGITLNIIPQKYFNMVSSYLWMEHMSLYFMQRDLYPIFSWKDDVHFICGTEKAYVTDPNFCENPIYTFNKKIYSS